MENLAARTKITRKQNESEWQVLCTAHVGEYKIIHSSSYLVGLIIKAPTSFLLNRHSLLIKRSSIGTTKASVFPEPVTASTTTSLCCIKRGIVDACTGVIWAYPIALITSRLERMRTGYRPMLTYIHPWGEWCGKRRP